MVTEKINQTGYLYFAAGATNQVESANKSQFADVMETAERSYERVNKAEADTVPEEKEVTEEIASESEGQEVHAEKKTDNSKNSEAKEAEEVDLEKIDEQLMQDEIPVNVVFTQLVQQIAEQLGVSLEDVQESMMELGLSVEDLQNPQNLLKLITDVMDLQGPEELLTNPQLAEVFKKLNRQLGEMISDMPLEEVVSEKMEMESIVVEAVTEEGTSGMEQESAEAEPGNGQQPVMDNTIQNSGFVANVKLDIAQNIQELLVDRVDYETTVDIVKQVSEQVKLNMSSDVTSIEMQLYPEHLGKVSIQVASKNGVLTAQIAAESEAAKVALESQIQTLKESLEQQGLKVEHVEVMVSTRGFEQQHDGKGDASDTEKQSKQFKGAQISEASEEENPEESEEMKETLGNTVSYMA